MQDALTPCSPKNASSTVRPTARMGRFARIALVALAGCALAACGGGASEEASGEHRTEHQTTESHVTAGDESTNSGGHGEDPNASHDPEGADGVHDEAAPQPHPDESTAEGSAG